MPTDNIIDSVVKTSKSRDIVRKMIPMLISWARQGRTDMTYQDMAKAADLNTWRIGHQLGLLHDVFTELEKRTGRHIPVLNTFCKSKSTKVPSCGFSYVERNYESMTLDEQQKIITLIENDAINYPDWDWVLDQLGLLPAKAFTEEDLENISKNFRGFGGEGPDHKALKEYLQSHPETIGVSDVESADVEHCLPSGDRLDLHFNLKNGDRVAVEVKPATAPDDDVTRGIFQCVKYRAVLDAMKKAACMNYKNRVILAIGGTLSESNRNLADLLAVPYFESIPTLKQRL